MERLPGANLMRRSSQELRDTARRMRKQATDAERIFWEAVRGGKIAGLRFRRQHPVATYVLDFYCPARRLVVEIDGSIHSTPDVAERDRLREDALRAAGCTVVRFSNAEVMGDLAGVIQRLRAMLGV